jgi:hypothetical protein
MKRTDWIVALGLLLCAALVLAACGGGGSTASGGGSSASGTAEGSSGASGGASSGTTESAAEEEETQLEFAECMRAQGIEVEDPKPGQSLVIGDEGDPATKEAITNCDRRLGIPGQELSAEENEEFKEGWLAFAKCVREHGVDMADPEFLGPGQVHLDRSAAESPAFEAAREACQGKTLELHGINIGG